MKDYQTTKYNVEQFLRKEEDERQAETRKRTEQNRFGKDLGDFILRSENKIIFWGVSLSAKILCFFFCFCYSIFEFLLYICPESDII